jgi:hypothetical protein
VKCPSCGLDNLPTSVRCYDCGRPFDPEKSYLSLSGESDKPQSGFEKWLRTLPLPGPIIDGDSQTVLERALLLPFVWVPGLALWAMDHYEKGLALLILTVIPLLLGFTLFNHWISNFLIPFGLLVYLWSLIDGFYTWRERHYPIVPSLITRIKAMGVFIVGFALIFVLWAPVLQVIPILQSGYEPDLTLGDYVFLNSRPGVTRTYDRQDLVAITYSKTTILARLIGFPNETIYVQKNNFYAHDKQADTGLIAISSTLNEPNRRIDIPPNSYFVFLDLSGEGLIRYGETAIIPAYDVEGRLEAVINPAAHRRRLR